MTARWLALLAVLTLGLVACESSNPEVRYDASTDGAKKDGPGPGQENPTPSEASVDGQGPRTDARTDGPRADGPRTDGLKLDGLKLDAKKDGPAADSKKDAPADAKKDAPADAKKDVPVTSPDGPKSGDGAKPADLFVLPDKFLGDAPPAFDSIIGKAEAGAKYLCKSSTGATVVCECNDGKDNDGDGKIDYPNDTGCIGPWDNSELGGATQCSDGIDNDGDGLIDAADPGCTGPLDNDESSFATGIPGDNMDPCKQDCFFDGNSGAGDDKCDWNLKCDPANPGSYLKKSNGDPLCPYDASYKNCPSAQNATCLQKCQKLTPNGCDCFGCCTMTYGGVTKSVMLTATCQLQYLNDPAKCPPCTVNTACNNPCGLCEVCIGKPAPDPSCFPKKDLGPAAGDGKPPTGDGTPPTGDGKPPTGDGKPPTGDGGSNPFCFGGYIYCGPGGIDPNSCPVGTYCITGCCVPIE